MTASSRWNWLKQFPTQQGLALVTIAMWVPTCICSLAACKINDGWYGTLTTLTFATVLHYGIKRWSFKPGFQDVDAESKTP
jgi:hypothetical protein